MDKEDRIKMLEDAQEKINEAIEFIEIAIQGTPGEQNTKAYLLDRLKIMAGEGHGFLSNDLHLDKVIYDIRKGGE